jgi:hypothetical protein
MKVLMKVKTRFCNERLIKLDQKRVARKIADSNLQDKSLMALAKML